MPDTTTFPGSDYYIIKLVEYSRKMHSDLNPTKLRGYVQVNADGSTSRLTRHITSDRLSSPPRIVRSASSSSTASRPATAAISSSRLTKSVMGAGDGPIPGEKYTQNRADIHLHGGRTPWISDGTPHQWITPAGETTPYTSRCQPAECA